MLTNDMRELPPSDQPATIRDVNDMAEAIMQHVIKEDAALRAKLDQVEAETIALRRRGSG